MDARYTVVIESGPSYTVGPRQITHKKKAPYFPETKVPVKTKIWGG